MTEKGKKRLGKAWEGSKMLAAIGALTTAIVGFNSVVEKQEVMLYVLSAKVNALSVKVAFLEGRLDSGSREEAHAMVKDKIRPAASVMASIKATIDAQAAENKPTMVTTEVAGTADAVADVPVKVRRFMPTIPDLAYQDMPTSLGDLNEFQRQIQQQEE